MHLLSFRKLTLTSADLRNLHRSGWTRAWDVSDCRSKVDSSLAPQREHTRNHLATARSLSRASNTKSKSSVLESLHWTINWDKQWKIKIDDYLWTWRHIQSLVRTDKTNKDKYIMQLCDHVFWSQNGLKGTLTIN